MKLDQIIHYLQDHQIEFQLFNTNPQIEVQPASLKKVISNGLYYIVSGSELEINEIYNSVILSDNFFKTDNTLIIVENPQIVHYKLANLDQKSTLPEIHSTAIIHPEALISENVFIGPFCVIGKCKIEGNVVIKSHVVINDNCFIQNGTTIDSHSSIGPSGLAWIWDENHERIIQPQVGGVKIGKNCHIATDVTIVRGSLSEDTEIGDSTVIAHGTKIGHGTIVEKNVHMANNVSLAGNSYIGERSFLGSACIISSNIRIPKNTIVGAGAMVNKNFEPEYCTLAGIPAKIIQENNYKNKPKGAPKPIK